VSDLKERVLRLAQTVAEGEGQVKLLERQIAEAATSADAAALQEKLLTYTNEVLLKMEGRWRQSHEQGLAKLLSQGLSATFSDDIQVSVRTSEVRGATSMELRLTQGGVEIGNIIEGTGGSIVSMLNVLLRLLLLVSIRPPITPLLVLDEPFRMVESRHLPALGQLLRELGERLGVQLVIVSHEEALQDAADMVYEVVPGPDGSMVKLVKSRREERT